MSASRKVSNPPVEAPPLRLEWRDADELAENPANWRTHPQGQVDALRDVIGEVGWAGALLYNERTGRLIDGHGRKKISTGKKVPVLIGSWDEAQENKILATLDPIAAMAGANAAQLDALLRGVETGSEAVAALLASLAEENGIIPGDEKPTGLKGVDVQPPPVMAWVLIGIPTVRYGEIAGDMERIGQIEGVICETTANNG